MEHFEELTNQGFSKELKKKNKTLAIIVSVALILLFLPSLFIFRDPNSRIFGLPCSIVYLSFMTVVFVPIIVLAYKSVFKPWSEKIDNE